jgi:hypothetical protein
VHTPFFALRQQRRTGQRHSSTSPDSCGHPWVTCCRACPAGCEEIAVPPDHVLLSRRLLAGQPSFVLRSLSWLPALYCWCAPIDVEVPIRCFLGHTRTARAVRSEPDAAVVAVTTSPGYRARGLVAGTFASPLRCLQIPVRSRTAAAAAIDRMDSMPLIASAIEANPSRLARILPSWDLRQNPCCPELSWYSSNFAVTFFFLRMGPVGYKGGYAAGYSALCEQAPQPKRITLRSPA